MDNKNRHSMVEKIRELVKVLPYLLPAVALSLSLASSLLVAGGVKNGTYSPQSMPSGPTPTPTATGSAEPPSDLSAGQTEADGFVTNASGALHPFVTRINVKTAPVVPVEPVPESDTMNTSSAWILPVTDPQNSAFDVTLVTPTGTKGGTATLTGDDLSGFVLHYTPANNFQGDEYFEIDVEDLPTTLDRVIKIRVHVS